MNFSDFIIFLIIDLIVQDLVVKWEIRNNIDLFVDIEVPERWKKKDKK